VYEGESECYSMRDRDEGSYGDARNTQYFIALVAMVTAARFRNRAIIGGRVRSGLASLAMAATVVIAACDTPRPVTAPVRAARQQHDRRWGQRRWQSDVVA
jgi:hypothetical protein